MKIIFDCREGFFAAMTWAVYCWRHADKTKRKIHVVVNGPYGQNYLNRYIEQYYTGSIVNPDDEDSIRVRNYSELKFPNYRMDRETANWTFLRHAEIRKRVINEADMFTVDRFLGAHYRGTDKSHEAKQIPFVDFEDKVKEYRKKRSFGGVFFSTDVRGLTLSGDDVIQRHDSYRSDAGFPVHKSGFGTSKDIGMDAIVNCLILSRCKVLIRTRSRLSAWAGILNPELPMVTLNDMHGKVSFPEEEGQEASNEQQGTQA